jgi:uncharacterized membrane protein
MRRDNTTTERIATFSDGMIAVIITIMVLELKAPEDPKLSAIVSLTELAALPVAIYAAIFVLVNGAYVFFEREALVQADATTMTGRAPPRALQVPDRPRDFRPRIRGSGL